MDVIELTPEILEIDNIGSSNFKIDDDYTINNKPSINFGSGLELLMNDKKTQRSNGAASNIDIEDITKLEDELNELSEFKVDNDEDKKFIFHNKEEEKKEKKQFDFGGMFGFNKKDGKNISSKEVNLGKASSELNENKTWDGYGKFNNVPLSNTYETKVELSREEELRKKHEYIRKLTELEKKGAVLSKRYDMESNLDEMIGEYESIIAEKEQSNSIKFQGKMLMAFITGVEFLNNKFDPFDIKLDGWGENINENINDYDEIFKELHEKYKSKAKMSPELKLLFQLGSSAVMVHMSNTLLKSSIPGMDDIMRQNPELMKQFTQAAVNTMGQQSPGFSGFMNSVMNNSNRAQPNTGGLGFGPREMPPNINNGPPPAPVETKLPDRSKRTQNFSNRPDIMEAKGISLDNHADPLTNDKILRPEMKGPSIQSIDPINSLLNGLKTKTETTNKDASTISIEDLNNMSNFAAPKGRSKRKQKSDKNTVSLDI